MQKESTKPFPETVKALMEEQEVSMREVARRCEGHNGWGSPSMISMLQRGVVPPALEAMENIARALRVKPEVFAEYRLEKVRTDLDYRHRPLQSCLRSLKNLSSS